MNIETQELDNHQVKLIVETPIEPLESAKQQAARKIARRTKIPGFRPGKAPYAMIVRHLGEEVIMDEAIEIMVNDLYPKVITEAQVDPYGPGALEKIVSIDPPKFEFIVPLKPKVELGDYLTVRVPFNLKEITDKNVEDVINNFRDRQAIVESVDRPAQIGDMIYLEISGKRKTGAEGEKEELVKNRRITVLIEDKEETLEYPFPGFSRHLIGMTSGSVKEIDHTFPKDFYVEALRGIQADYHISVEDVKSRTLPNLDDDFAKSVGDYANLDELKAAIQEELVKQATDEYNTEYDDQVLNDIIKISTIKYPPQMLEEEIESVIHQLKDRLANQKLDIDLYLKTRKMTMEDLKRETKPIAESRLSKMLVLMEVSRLENIKMDAKEAMKEATHTMGELSRTVTKKNLPRATEDELVADLAGNIMMDKLVKRTMERLREIAGGKVEEGKAESEIKPKRKTKKKVAKPSSEDEQKKIK